MTKETLLTSESQTAKTSPQIKPALEEKYKEEKRDLLPPKEPLNPENIQDTVDELPIPSGWRLLVLPFIKR